MININQEMDTMFFDVDNRKKDLLCKKLIRKTCSFYFLPWLCICVSGVGTVLLLAYFILNPMSFIITDVFDPNYGKKAWYVVVTLLVLMNLLGGVLSIIFKIGIRRLYAKDLSEKTNERIKVKNDCLIYSYQLIGHTNGNDRVVIKVPFSFLHNVIYDSDKNAIKLTGDMAQIYYKDYARKKTDNTEAYEMMDLIIYEYYQESVLEVFAERNLMIKEGVI